MLFNDALANSKQIISDIKVVYKEDSLLMRLLSLIMFFNKTFMTEYTTTIGHTIYYPRSLVENRPDTAISILCHEVVHMMDAQNNNKAFNLLYFFPQFLFLLFLPLDIIFNWKVAIFALLFLLPIPSYFRMLDEKRAYVISMYSGFKLKNEIETLHLDYYCNQFFNSSYYYMWPFAYIKDEMKKYRDSIKNGEKPLLNSQVYDAADKILS